MGDYPKMKFHVRGGGYITVTSAAQEKALGAEWIDRARAVDIADAPVEVLPVLPKKRGRPARQESRAN